MAPLADFLLKHAPIPHLPYHLTHYVRGATPLSTQPVVLSVLAGYLATIFGIREIMKTRQPQKLTFLFQVHNAVLSSGSALLLVLMLEEIVPIYWRHGVFSALCGSEAWTERMEMYYIINYYIKYVELLDTVFLALKKKPLAFLHVYHHSATAFLCFTQLNGKTSISWTVITQNLAVHVLMCYLITTQTTIIMPTAGGAKIWWKKYLTTMQIVQFVVDLHLVYFGTYSYFASTYWPHLPVLGTCHGTESAAVFGCALLSSYLLLFIKFYIDTYKKPARGKKSVTNGHATANGNGLKED
ncbi:elongase of fatty acids ELO [Lactarius akahatsu]|uniref:Elongation of fatty acids protein n=1 Tax=Lactarius akahatsu TaxID=416441 RepID=A0AAD4QDP6_9AGAM|nr:elongase of fatty acids ELO [Lactarius akahatsu]